MSSKPTAIDEVKVEKVIWPATKQPAALGELGMDVTTGKPRVFVEGIAQDLAAVGANNVFTKAQSAAIKVLTPGTNIPVSGKDSNVQEVTLDRATSQLDNATDLTDGQTIVFLIIQDVTGNRALTFGSNYDFGTEGAPDLTTSIAGQLDTITAIARSGKLHCGVSRGHTA
ncbi:hypothetical protein LCGC14_1447770 [marine sediment metagenome]|uniref:Uncharacterized protein n=1 Tax=marine sediment metagenome TaxID=412755 RepID=A0A0F9K508_9ZZZZ